ncbi:MAG: extracellular solute-binding protein [Bacilli bacterium]
MKKTVSLLSVGVLAAGILAGCGPKEETKAPVKNDKGYDLLVWEDKDKAIGLTDAVKAFEEANGVKVKVLEVMMTDQIKQIRLDGQSENAPDVITIPHDQIGGAVVEGHIKPLNVGQATIDTFTETSIQAQTYDGKLYGLPKSVETPVFVYNKALMDKAPATMEELYNFAKTNTKDDKYGFLALWDNFYFAYAAMGGMGGYVFGAENGVPNVSDLGLNNEGAVQGADWMRKWYAEGLFPAGLVGEKGGSTMDGLFTEGKVAAVMNGPWSFQPYADAGIDIGVAPLPTLPNGKPMQTFQGVKGWHVTSFSKNEELATKFVEFITNADNAKIRFEKTQEIPPVKALMEQDIIKNNEKANAVAQQSVNALPMPNVPEMQEVWGPMGSALQLMATNKQATQAALDEAVKQIAANIEANHKK